MLFDQDGDRRTHQGFVELDRLVRRNVGQLAFVLGRTEIIIFFTFIVCACGCCRRVSRARGGRDLGARRDEGRDEARGQARETLTRIHASYCTGGRAVGINLWPPVRVRPSSSSSAPSSSPRLGSIASMVALTEVILLAPAGGGVAVVDGGVGGCAVPLSSMVTTGEETVTAGRSCMGLGTEEEEEETGGMGAGARTR